VIPVPPRHTYNVSKQHLLARAKLSAALAMALLVPVSASAQATSTPANWVGSWAASQQLPESQNQLSADDLHDATLRQIVHLSIGGTQMRVRLSNAFGTAPLHLTSVHIARPVSNAAAAIDAASDKALTFGGAPDVIIPAGADYVSDLVAFPATPLSDLAITLHLDEPPAQQTGHPGSRATSYLAQGDMVSAAELPNPKQVQHWYQIAGVDVIAAPQARSVVTLGDSITDGHGASTNANERWPDVLAKRLQSATQTRMIGVLNQGIGGNRLLLDGLGPNALARFDRDVLAQSGIHYLIVLEGVNDLGTLTRDAEVSQSEHDALVHRILSAYEQIATRAHAHGIYVIGATITPYAGSDYYHPGPASEADRQAINKWIRQTKVFDAVIDFDKVIQDPAHPDHISPTYDSGDHLHPSPAGYRAMADAIPLALFTH
jgi:lysophospholipase L1-like esterase